MEQHDTREQGEDEQNVNEKNIKENKIGKISGKKRVKEDTQTQIYELSHCCVN